MSAKTKSENPNAVTSPVTHPATSLITSRETRAKGQSLEWELKLLSAVFIVLVTGLFALVAHFSNMPLKLALTLYLVAMLVLLPYLFRVYKRIVHPMNNLANVIEAIRLEDYGLSPKVTFKEGVMAQLLGETSALVDVLQKRKERYNQQVYLIYRLIEQLELPVLVFDEDLRLVHGNAAFDKWYGQPWKTVRGLSSKRIGLVASGKNSWQFVNPDAHKGWQIKSSRFENEKDSHQLLILNNINSEVRQVQQDAWMQIIRVLTHEIRNSLTPICSMTDLMLDMPTLSEDLKTPLQVIESRSNNLLQFVERYADTARPVQVNKKQLDMDVVLSKIRPLFPENSIKVVGKALQVLADPVLLEQVLINLIRNALEAQASNGNEQPIQVQWQDTNGDTTLYIKDRGRGIANPDNLFVPFYTTKEGGQGIGLALCRKIIEQHNGNLHLSNRNKGGAVAKIVLPKG